MAFPQGVIQKDPDVLQTALYTIGSFLMNTSMDHDPVDLYLQKNLSVSLLKNAATNKAGESLRSVWNEVAKMANQTTTLENGNRKKYNEVIISMIGNAVHQINGDRDYDRPETQLPLPDLGKCRECAKDGPCKNYSLITVYLDLSDTVFQTKMDTNQKGMLDGYRKALLECKDRYEQFCPKPAPQTIEKMV